MRKPVVLAATLALALTTPGQGARKAKTDETPAAEPEAKAETDKEEEAKAQA